MRTWKAEEKLLSRVAMASRPAAAFLLLAFPGSAGCLFPLPSSLLSPSLPPWLAVADWLVGSHAAHSLPGLSYPLQPSDDRRGKSPMFLPFGERDTTDDDLSSHK